MGKCNRLVRIDNGARVVAEGLLRERGGSPAESSPPASPPASKPGAPWREHEDAVIHAWAEKVAGQGRVKKGERLLDGVTGAASELPGRSRDAVASRARRMGVHLTRPGPWTRAELATLKAEWHEVTLRTLQQKLPRRSACAITRKARRLGLPFGVPQGCLGLTEAARKTAYDVKQLHRMFEAAGQPIRVVQTYRKAPVKNPRRYVEEEHLELAIRLWEASEVVAHAARCRDVSDTTLRRWLVLAGYAKPAPAAGRARAVWRVGSEAIDRVVAARGALRNDPLAVAAPAVAPETGADAALPLDGLLGDVLALAGAGLGQVRAA
jgi:hypothetical protein